MTSKQPPAPAPTSHQQNQQRFVELIKTNITPVLYHANQHFQNCYTNSSSITKYIKCIKHLQPLSNKVQKRFELGLDFLMEKNKECFKYGKSAEECLERGTVIVEELAQILKNEYV